MKLTDQEKTIVLKYLRAKLSLQKKQRDEQTWLASITQNTCLKSARTLLRLNCERLVRETTEEIKTVKLKS